MSGPVTRVTHIQLTLAIMVVIPLTVTLIRATVTLIRATVMATAMGDHMSGAIGAKADALPGELIGDGTAGIRASAPPTKRLADHVFQSPRLDRVQLTAALRTAEPR